MFRKPIVSVCLISHHHHHDNDNQRFECNITRLISPALSFLFVSVNYMKQLKLNSNSHNNILFILDDNLCLVVNQGLICKIFIRIQSFFFLFLNTKNLVSIFCCYVYVVFLYCIEKFPR